MTQPVALGKTALLAAAFSVLLAGCISVGIGTTDTPGLAYYVLEDARPVTAHAPSAVGNAATSLAVHSAGGDPLTDSTAIVYARRPGERSLYQLAAWNERPTRRIAQLVQQRLEASGHVAAVAQLGQPVQTDWLLTLALEQMFHDVSSTPGRARLTVRAELIDRRTRTRLAWRQFAAAPAVSEANAAAAAAAFAQATADVLDQLAPWVESSLTAGAHR